ncbi:uncharacterized protein LOC124417655 [Gallus gallus]|uniref:uncharacterized protein LOC124417655 n=1 Tax=Gallus gallus TaxID=9031 RepID=UPI001F0244A3|nr:uncharacterized protein LOC124417655 [Gallus gallus]
MAPSPAVRPALVVTDLWSLARRKRKKRKRRKAGTRAFKFSLHTRRNAHQPPIAATRDVTAREAAYEMARCAKPVGNESQIHPDRDRSARRRRLAAPFTCQYYGGHPFALKLMTVYGPLCVVLPESTWGYS